MGSVREGGPAGCVPQPCYLNMLRQRRVLEAGARAAARTAQVLGAAVYSCNLY